jgi:hypothetical protein
MRRIFSVVTCLMVLGAATLAAQTNVLTWHNDNWRSGANAAETTLTTANVTNTLFGKVCTATTDGAINAQPLIVAGVPFRKNGTTTIHDIAYVATENDTLYAFDASSCALLRSVSMVPMLKGCTPGVTCEQPVDCKSIGAGGCQTVAPVLGILSTPVIQAVSGANGTTGTIYVMAETQVGAGTTISAWKHRLHALDIATLAELPGSPTRIKGTYGSITFSSKIQIQRPGLLLLNGVGPNGDNMVYAGFSLMDGAPKVLGSKPPGWILGYDTTNLNSQPTGLPYTFVTTPNGAGPDGPGGGVWQAGAGLSAGLGSATDQNTYIYFGTGDGTWDANTLGNDYGDSFLKVSTALQVAGYFTRYNELSYKSANVDFGSGGMMLVPDNTFANFPYISVNAGKDGNIYVIDRGSPGGYNGVFETNIQTVPGKFPYFGTPAFWNGHIYDSIVGGSLRGWTMSDSCSPGPVCSTNIRSTFTNFPNGTTPAVSSNGTLPGTGILWAIASPNQVNGGVPAILYAFDAVKLTRLYSTADCGTKDTPGLGVKFTVPTIANGKVYIGTQGELDVYGELPASRTCP